MPSDTLQRGSDRVKGWGGMCNLGLGVEERCLLGPGHLFKFWRLIGGQNWDWNSGSEAKCDTSTLFFFFQWRLWVLRSCDPLALQSRESLRELLSLAHLSPVLIIRVLSLFSILGCALRSPSSVPRCPLFPGVVGYTRARPLAPIRILAWAGLC